MNTLLKFSGIIAAFLLFSGCATTQGDWEKASQQNNIWGYLSFISKHPNSEYEKQARDRIEQLNFQKAKSAHSESELISFLSKYPHSSYTAEANKLLEELAYKKALSANSEAPYNDYINRFPQGSHYNEISDLLNKLKAEKLAALTLGERFFSDGILITDAAILREGYQKTTAAAYTQAFAAPEHIDALNGITMHTYVIRMLEASGQRIVPGCIAEYVVSGGRFKATVKHASPSVWSMDRSGFFKQASPPQGVPGGTIKIIYTSEDMHYAYYDTGNEKIISEKIVRKATKGDSGFIIEAVKIDGVYYLKEIEK